MDHLNCVFRRIVNDHRNTQQEWIPNVMMNIMTLLNDDTKKAYPLTAKITQERLLLSSSLAHVKTAESNLHVSAARLESAKKLYPSGLLTKEVLLTIQGEYIINKIRYDAALEEAQQRWLSLKVVEEDILKNDR